MNYEEQKKVIRNGLSCNILCHIQKVHKQGIVYPAHYHSYIELLYGIKGNYDVLLNGQLHNFGPGDLTLINSKEVHQINSITNEGGEYIVIRFEPEILYNSMFDNYQNMQYVLPFLLENADHQKVIPKEIIKDTFIPELMFETLNEFIAEDYGYELAMKNHIGRIFLWILRYFHTKGLNVSLTSCSSNALFQRLQPCLDYVAAHYQEDIKANEMSTLCNMSYSYFSRSFNEYLGRSFHDYVNYIRIREAEKLLVATTMNVTEVSNEVGFATTSYFIKQFQKNNHISPKQFQKKFGMVEI